MASQLLGVTSAPTTRACPGSSTRWTSSCSGADGERRLVKDALGDAIEMREVKPTEPGQRRQAHARRRHPGPRRGGARRRSARSGKPKGATAIVMDPRDGVDPRARQLAAGERQRARRRARLRAPGPRDRRDLRAGLDVQGVHGRRRAARRARSRPTPTFNLAADDPGRRPRDRRVAPARLRARCTTRQILEQSSNVGAITIGQRLGADRLRQVGAPLRLRQADRHRPAGRGAGHRAHRSSDYSGSSMGNLPIGQGIAVTPMQMATAYAAIANGGILRPPHIVEDVGGRAARKPQGHRIISEATAASLRRMLEGVLGPGGTASGAAIHGYVLAGKTGTAEKPDPSTAATRRPSTSRRSSASRPPRQPKLLVAVMVDEPQGDIYGGTVAAPGVQGDHELRAQLPEDPADRVNHHSFLRAVPARPSARGPAPPPASGSSTPRSTSSPRAATPSASVSRGRAPRRRRHRQRLPPLPVQGRPVRRGLPARVAARGRRAARRSADRSEPVPQRLAGVGRGVRAPRAGRAGARLRADRRAGRPGGRGRAARLPPRLRRPVRRARCATAIARGELPAARRRPRRRGDRRRARRGAASARSPRRDAGADALVAGLQTFVLSAIRVLEPCPRCTHEVLEPVRRRSRTSTCSTADLALREALEREGAGWAVDRVRDFGAVAGSAEALEHGRRAERNEPRLRHARPLRPPHRPGRARPELALAAARRGRARDPRAAVARPAAGRARRARGARAAVDAGQRRRDVPGLDDLLGGAGAARATRARRRVGAAADAARLRARRAVRDGDDREAGRLGRARQHHARRAGRRRLVRAHRPQVVLLVSAVRRLPRARAGARRALVLPARARPGDGVPAPQGQARHALAAVVARSSSAAPPRGCSARRAAAWRRSSRWSRTRGSTA